MKTINLTPATINKWAKMTNKNFHGKVRSEIAKRFGYDNYQKTFDEINEQHDARGALTYDLYTKRLQTSEAMLNDIRNEYGTEIYEKVLMGL